MIKDVCEVRECPDCASGNIVCNADRQQMICRDCGLIFEPLTPPEEELFERTHELVASRTAPKAKGKASKTRTARKKK